MKTILGGGEDSIPYRVFIIIDVFQGYLQIL
jgi:hypothetical protein